MGWFWHPRASKIASKVFNMPAIRGWFLNFDAAPVSEDTPAGDGGPSQEEQQLLGANPSYKYLPEDPRFPNREPGVYPMGSGNEWRNDPDPPMASNTQAPIDPHTCCDRTSGAGKLGSFYLPFFARVFAHLAGCAAATLLRPATEIVCFLRSGLVPA